MPARSRLRRLLLRKAFMTNYAVISARILLVLWGAGCVLVIRHVFVVRPPLGECDHPDEYYKEYDKADAPSALATRGHAGKTAHGRGVRGFSTRAPPGKGVSCPLDASTFRPVCSGIDYRYYRVERGAGIRRTAAAREQP